MTEPTGYTAVGMVGFTDKGTYSASASYVKNDLVHYGGSIWCCLIDDTTGIAPTEGTNWTLFVGEPTNMAERIIAPLEVSPSENAYSIGEQLIFNDVLYKAKTAIAVGDALVVDTNIEVAPKISSQIQTLTNNTNAEFAKLNSLTTLTGESFSSSYGTFETVYTTLEYNSIIAELNIRFTPSSAISAWTNIGSLPNNIKPRRAVSMPLYVGATFVGTLRINTTGILQIENGASSGVAFEGRCMFFIRPTT